MKRISFSSHVVAHKKSVVLGGARVLFPVDPSLTKGFAREIKATIEAAESAAYARGVKDAQAAMRRSLGFSGK